MKMNFEIVSEEFIKPSSPTPPDRRIHTLSLMDQIVPPFFAPMIFYYPNLGNSLQNPKTSISPATQILKQSLSTALSRFYPLAGRIRDNLSIDCNDKGLLFIVSKFQENLTECLKNPNPSADLNHIPAQLTWDEPGPGDQVAKVQVNEYACGGLVIGLVFFHKLADGVSMGSFVKDWASIARGDTLSKPGPTFDFHAKFPHNPEMKRDSHLFTVVRRYFKVGRPAIRRYVFDAEAIRALRARLAGPDGPVRPSRVEAVTAAMWKYFMTACAAASNDGDEPKTSLITHVMNMRKKAEPELAENSFGNLVWLGPGTSENDKEGRELGELFSKVRCAIRKVDSGFVGRMEGEGGFEGYRKNLEGSWREFPEEADYLSISSWCNFGLYGADFGWGRPVWVTKCDAETENEWPFLNMLWLMDTRGGDGVEAWINLDRKYLEAFDGIEELRELARVSPSPLETAGIVMD